jgi:RNA-binding protein NOB1
MLEKEVNGVSHIKTEPKIQEKIEKKTEAPLDPFKVQGTEGGWITPENIKAVNSGKGEALTGKNNVGCVTTDFAMQNVLLQMGLNLISIDGMLLKNVKQWVLRCYGCNKYKNIYIYLLLTNIK